MQNMIQHISEILFHISASILLSNIFVRTLYKNLLFYFHKNSLFPSQEKLAILSAQKIRIICFVIKHLFAPRKLELIATN